MGQQDPADFVLKQFSKEEKNDLPEFLDRGADVVESLIERGLDFTQSKFNSLNELAGISQYFAALLQHR